MNVPVEELLHRIEDLERRVQALEQAAANNANPTAQISTSKARTLDIPRHTNSSLAPVPEGNMTPDEKIALFMELFAHSSDRYALHYISKNGKQGYSPVCANKWKSGLCNMKLCQNGKCSNRALLPLEPSAIRNHLAGKDIRENDVIGVYPISSDNTVRFLVFDFDDDDSQEAALAVHRAAIAADIPTHIERSRSGTGAHLWIFFSEPVTSKDARLLGSRLLAQAMSNDSQLGFESYDRMIPAQDALPPGGFGNLIALPLQGKARQVGNSVFVDESFTTIPQQWAYLKEAQSNRVNTQQLKAALKDLPPDDFETDPSRNNSETGQQTIPGTARKRKAVRKLTKSDFPKSLTIIRSDALLVSRSGLSEQAIYQIRKLASFENPAFYQMAALGKSTYKIPRIISYATLDEEYLSIPRGCEERLVMLLEASNASFEFADETIPGKKIKVSFKGELREEQTPAAQAMCTHDMGILWAATGYGKTVISAYIIAKTKRSALVLVHSQALLRQWQGKLQEFLDIDEPLPEPKRKRGRKKRLASVGMLGAGKNTLTGNVDVMTYQSLAHADDPQALLDQYGVLVVDECHHSSALNYAQTIQKSAARRIYGVSATPQRRDGHHPISYMVCGPVRYKRTAKEQAAQHSFKHVVIPRLTSFARPITIDADEWNITKAQQAIAIDAPRNKQIVSDAHDALEAGRSPIVLTARVEQARKLHELIGEDDSRVFLLVGKEKTKAKRERDEALRAAAAKGPVCVIATGSYAGEGFDLPRLDTLLLAAPISGRTPLSQYTGRLHREHPGKQEVIVYDYVDLREPLLERMYHRRLKGYAALGYSIRAGDADADVGAEEADVFTGATFKGQFLQDLRAARHEIVICSPTLHKSRMYQIVQACEEAMTQGAKCMVITQPAEQYATTKQTSARELLGMLEKSPITLRERAEALHRFAVIDGELVWYGSANLLGYWSDDECEIRFRDARTATQLLESVRE